MIIGTVNSKRHWKLKEKALKLRRKGLSYRDILKQIPVAKSTISLWCREIPLSLEQKRNLSTRHDKQLKGIKAIQNNFWKLRQEAFNKGVLQVSDLTRDSRFIAGLMLYWAEGSKSGTTALANSNPLVIKFFVDWLNEFYNINPYDMVIHLHLHSGQEEAIMQKYWSGMTKIPVSNFKKSFIKPEGSGYRKNILYNGTVKVRVRKIGSTYLLFQILGAIAGFLNQSIKEKPEIEFWINKLPYADSGPLAQLAEQIPLKDKVLGSTPRRPTKR